MHGFLDAKIDRIVFGIIAVLALGVFGVMLWTALLSLAFWLTLLVK